tara:strand:- start:1990 stop:2226 length:237 start_codon:yes stop_codon:yes gene_type:complete
MLEIKKLNEKIENLTIQIHELKTQIESLTDINKELVNQNTYLESYNNRMYKLIYKEFKNNSFVDNVEYTDIRKHRHSK